MLSKAMVPAITFLRHRHKLPRLPLSASSVSHKQAPTKMDRGRGGNLAHACPEIDPVIKTNWSKMFGAIYVNGNYNLIAENIFMESMWYAAA